jgi:hypothetical protein
MFELVDVEFTVGGARIPGKITRTSPISTPIVRVIPALLLPPSLNIRISPCDFSG